MTDLNAYVNIFKQEGTARSDRYAPALNPATIRIDDRRLEDFIIYAQQYAKHILFVDTEDGAGPDQSWEEFFKDRAVLLSANIATKDTGEIKKAYDFLFDAFKKEETVESFSRILNYVFSRFKKIDQWYASSAPYSTLNGELHLYIKSYLAKELERLNAIILYINNLTAGKEDGLHIDTGLLNKNNIWGVKEETTPSLGAHVFAGTTDKEKLYNALLFTNKIFDAVFHVTSTVINASKTYFKDAIYEQQSLPPHIALYVTFVSLFGVVQQEMNRLPARILDFYYKEVIRIGAQKAVPDKAFVIFEIGKGFDFYKVAKGTALLAGKDKSKVERNYITDKEIIVNRGTVDAIKTIFIQRFNGLITWYYGQPIKESGADITDSSWRTFGAAASTTATDVSTGFAIASTQLYLSKGERKVTITFDTEQDLVFDGWKEFDLSLIELWLTGEKGWISSRNPQDGIFINYLKKTDSRRLELDFAISVAQPSAVVAFDRQIHAGQPVTGMPVLKVLLRFPVLSPKEQAAPPEEALLKIRQLNFLLTVSIVRTIIQVQVGGISQKVNFDGVRDLQLENHETVLDPKKPFHPFTTMPRVGSSFYIGCNDLYYKKIQNLSLSIEWMLPDNFNSYYDKYFPPYDSNKFTASLSVLKNQTWNKVNDVSLIDAVSDSPKFRVIRVPNAVTAAAGEEPVNDASKFSTTKKNGTLRLKLNYPDFGHDVYPQLITSTVMEKASSKMGTVDFYKILKKELDDSVISIKLPPAGDQNYRLDKVVEVLTTINNNDQVKVMITTLLNDSLTKFNGVTIPLKELEGKSMSATLTLVNDDNFIERILRFLRKVKLIDRNIHFDKDKDSVEDVVENVNEKVNSRINFILPADQEMISLIISEVNNAIRRVITKAVDKIIESKKKEPASATTVAAIVTKEIEEANVVINDMVAKKIATLLAAHDIPPKPYTPLINTISISYTSVKELQRGEDEFFHILPFGAAATNAFPGPAFTGAATLINTSNLLPGLLLPAAGKSELPSGMLCIGLKHLAGGQNITLLFRVDQGSKWADTKPPAVSWWYLRNNEWIYLKEDLIISDSTYGLQTSGIVEIAVPQDITQHTTVFGEAGLSWLCASIPGSGDAFPDLTGIDTQAVTATFRDKDNDPMHPAFPLPAGSITRLAEAAPGIKNIRQPLASFGGKIKESETAFYTRVSERLRHKSRAVNNWDYERLVLEHFPFIFKVKCLNNYYNGRFIPGHVTVVPIVNLKNRLADGVPAEMPKASYLQLRQIEQFLAQRSSPFCKIHAINPQAAYLKVSCRVKFHTGVDKGFYVKKLNADLILFLTPWAGEADRLSFSTKVYASSVISFIDKKEYVDYVADLSIHQFTIAEDGTVNYCRLENGMIALTETQIITAHSILVSAPAHDIEPLE